jgi:hypothetical protein
MTDRFVPHGCNENTSIRKREKRGMTDRFVPHGCNKNASFGVSSKRDLKKNKICLLKKNFEESQKFDHDASLHQIFDHDASIHDERAELGNALAPAEGRKISGDCLA